MREVRPGSTAIRELQPRAFEHEDLALTVQRDRHPVTGGHFASRRYRLGARFTSASGASTSAVSARCSTTWPEGDRTSTESMPLVRTLAKSCLTMSRRWMVEIRAAVGAGSTEFGRKSGCLHTSRILPFCRRVRMVGRSASSIDLCCMDQATTS